MFKNKWLVLLVFALSLSGCQAQSQSANDNDTLSTQNVLSSFLLSNKDASMQAINGITLDEGFSLQVYNPETKAFEEQSADEAILKGNYVELIDTDSNEAADIVRLVRFEDGATYWDMNMAWKEGAGAAEPGIPDDIAFSVFSKESNIPYGQRLLDNNGIGEWSAAVDFWNQDTITYYPTLDIYNTTSSDTLTILPNYKTHLQPTGWTCGLSSALTVLEWYNLRGDLNDYDLANLRPNAAYGEGSFVSDLKDVFNELTELGLAPTFVMEDSYDHENALFDPSYVKNHLAAGHPIMVVWNAFGWHWQTIIGYDDMGSETTQDDVLIMMDPYDTTDQNADGYYLESYERLVYGVTPTADGGAVNTEFLVVYPEGYEYTQVNGEGIADNSANELVITDNKLSDDASRLGLKTYYPQTPDQGSNGLAGANGAEVFRAGDYNHSPYYNFFDIYNMTSTDSLHILSNFKTQQQSSEWTCGPTSVYMVLNHFNLAHDENEFSLAANRQGGVEGATTLKGMQEIFAYLNTTYNDDWVYISTDDLDDPDGEESYINGLCLQYDLIPYLLDNNIPVMVGSDEWGGHWQVLIGYDDMGSERTEDDVIIFADPYDTTDHNQDGYYIDNFERLVFGWYSSFEDVYKHNDFIAAFPRSAVSEEVLQTLGR